MELEGEFLKKGRNLQPSTNITKLDSDRLHFGVVHVVKLLSPAHCSTPTPTHHAPHYYVLWAHVGCKRFTNTLSHFTVV